MCPSSTSTPSIGADGATSRPPFHQFLAALPKCEHHMHIEGSLSPELLFALSAKNSVALPSEAEDPAFASPEALHARYARFGSLDDFLHYYYVGFTVLRTASDFEALAWEYLRRVSVDDNVRHTEIFFDPQMHSSRGVDVENVVVAGINAARARAAREFGTSSLLIPCLLRHLPVADGEATFAALRDAGLFAPPSKSPDAPPALAGLGICSSEKNVPPPSAWAPVFRAAAEVLKPTPSSSSPPSAPSPIRLTAHAGEDGPASAVTASLDLMGVSRIDHGVRAADDPAVLARLAAERVLLTVCPISNLRLRVVSSLDQVPIRRLIEAGVPFSINSDDPAYFGGYVLDNYVAVHEAFRLSVDEWAAIARNSIRSSWCEEARKMVLQAELEDVIDEWRGKLAP